MLRIRRRYERKRKCSFGDHFTLAKKEDDGNTRYEFGEGTVTTSAKEGAVFESILPQQKKGNDDVTSLEFGEGTSANESAVLETISPQQKRKTTVIHAKNSEKVPVTTSAKQGAVFESILPQQKKGDDDNTR